MKGPVSRLRALAARGRRPAPPAFPGDALLSVPAELAVPPEASPYSPAASTGPARPTLAPRCRSTLNPFDFAEAVLHVGETEVPVTNAEGRWPAGTTIIGIDGDTIIKATVDADGVVTAKLAVNDPPPPPHRRRGGPPNNCPCTAIYTECMCPCP